MASYHTHDEITEENNNKLSFLSLAVPKLINFKHIIMVITVESWNTTTRCISKTTLFLVKKYVKLKCPGRRLTQPNEQNRNIA